MGLLDKSTDFHWQRVRGHSRRQVLHVRALPDLRVQRSFPIPDGKGVQRGHFVTGVDRSQRQILLLPRRCRVFNVELMPEVVPGRLGSSRRGGGDEVWRQSDGERIQGFKGALSINSVALAATEAC
jgi:hypothetical protein